MANAVWKKFEKSSGYGWTKLFLRRVAGIELRLRPEIEIHQTNCGGWLFCPDLLCRGDTVYSLGVGDDISFDRALIEHYGVEVHAFDPTPASADWLDAQRGMPNFHFHQWAAAGRDGKITLYPRGKPNGKHSDTMLTMVAGAAGGNGIQVAAFSIPTIMRKLGHRHIDLMKIDIEGAEYEVIESLLVADCRPQQLLVEFHHRFPSIDKSMTANAIHRLRNVGYRIFAVSSTGREVSFIYRPEPSRDRN